MNKYFSFLLLVLIFSCQSFDSEIESYNAHVIDLMNQETVGYKASDAEIYQQGSLVFTNINLDLAIHGTGFFRFYDEANDSHIYSRDGRLKIDSSGFLTNNDGHRLVPEIRLSEDYKQNSIRIDQNNVLTYETAGSEQPNFETIQLYKNEAITYRQEGSYFYFESILIDTDSRIVSGFVETSNFSLEEKVLTIMALLVSLRENNVVSEISFTFKYDLLRDILYEYSQFQNGKTIAKHLLINVSPGNI